MATVPSTIPVTDKQFPSPGLGRGPTPHPSSSDTPADPSENPTPLDSETDQPSYDATRSSYPWLAPYPCDFAFAGCPHSFSTKSSWKSHVLIAHITEFLYLCGFPCCISSAHPFITHRVELARRHLEEGVTRGDIVTKHEGRATKAEMKEFLGVMKQRWRRAPTEAGCEVCGKRWLGERAWEKRMEHVGGHYGRGEKGEEGKVDEALVGWARGQRMIEWVGEGWRLRGVLE